MLFRQTADGLTWVARYGRSRDRPDGGLRLSTDSVTLAAGDVLVAYTDGISEAMNAAAKSGVKSASWRPPADGGPARTLIDRLMTSADTFVAGALQHDDMTLLVIRAI